MSTVQKIDPMVSATIPAEARFALVGVSKTVEFLEAPELESIAGQLLAECDELDDLEANGASIRFLWKREGGKSQGRETLGKATKMSGLAAHYADCDFVVWLAADHCRARELTNHQIEALVFHELLHCTASETPNGTKFGTVGHDFEFFASEVQRYGLWREELEKANEACAQRSLFEKGD